MIFVFLFLLKYKYSISGALLCVGALIFLGCLFLSVPIIPISKRHRVQALRTLKVSVVILGVVWMIHICPISSWPGYDVDSYEKLVWGVTGWEQHYLLPPVDYFQSGDMDYTCQIFIKANRMSYRPEGYLCIAEGNFSVEANRNGIPMLDKELQEIGSYNGVPLFYTEKDGKMIIKFSNDKMHYYVIASTKLDAQKIVESMLDAAYILN